jgi:hypothetical protein
MLVPPAAGLRTWFLAWACHVAVDDGCVASAALTRDAEGAVGRMLSPAATDAVDEDPDDEGGVVVVRKLVAELLLLPPTAALRLRWRFIWA